jgi:hypothetical protein
MDAWQSLFRHPAAVTHARPIRERHLYDYDDNRESIGCLRRDSTCEQWFTRPKRGVSGEEAIWLVRHECRKAGTGAISSITGDAGSIFRVAQAATAEIV